jgi:hypothetical protein
MKQGYLTLLAISLATAIALSVFGHRTPVAPHAADAHEKAPREEVAIVIANGEVSPAVTSVSKDHLVRLTVANGGPAPVALRLAGYEDRVAIATFAPRETRTIEFLADRPGDDFTWLVDGRPRGRFAVTGSHLIGDHR